MLVFSDWEQFTSRHMGKRTTAESTCSLTLHKGTDFTAEIFMWVPFKKWIVKTAVVFSYSYNSVAVSLSVAAADVQCPVALTMFGLFFCQGHRVGLREVFVVNLAILSMLMRSMS